MAAETYFLDPDGGGLVTADPGAEASTATGWTVAKVAPTVYALMSQGTERASGTFGATAVPDGTTGPNTGVGDFLETEDAIGAQVTKSGTYATGTWTATFKVIAVTSGSDQDGLIRAAIWRVDPANFAAAVLIAGPTEGGAVTNLTTAAAQTSTVTFLSVPAATLTNEMLVLQVGWKITGAGGANTRDVLLRKGTGITLVTPNFTATARKSLAYADRRVARNSLLRRHHEARNADADVFLRDLNPDWRPTRAGILVPSYG